MIESQSIRVVASIMFNYVLVVVVPYFSARQLFSVVVIELVVHARTSVKVRGRLRPLLPDLSQSSFARRPVRV